MQEEMLEMEREKLCRVIQDEVLPRVLQFHNNAQFIIFFNFVWHLFCLLQNVTADIVL